MCKILFTYLVNNIDQFLNFIRTDIRTVGEAKVDEAPLSLKVIA